MLARKIVCVVEGAGEVAAVPALLGGVLQHLGRHDIFPGQMLNAHGRANLTKPGGAEKFAEVAYRSSDCGAVLVLLDADNDCAMTLARNLAARIHAKGARRPTAIVLANRMYEAWIVASAPALVGKNIGSLPPFPVDVRGSDNPESVRAPKAWLESRMPRNRIYKETEDQLAFTRLIDIGMAHDQSRSFRRLLHAIQELLTAIDTSASIVTPKAPS